MQIESDTEVLQMSNNGYKANLGREMKTTERFPEKPGPPGCARGARALDPELAPAVRAALG